MPNMSSFLSLSISQRQRESETPAVVVYILTDYLNPIKLQNNSTCGTWQHRNCCKQRKIDFSSGSILPIWLILNERMALFENKYFEANRIALMHFFIFLECVIGSGVLQIKDFWASTLQYYIIFFIVFSNNYKYSTYYPRIISSSSSKFSLFFNNPQKTRVVRIEIVKWKFYS